MKALPAGAPAPVQDPLQWTFDPWSETPRTAVLASLSVLALWLLLAVLGLPWLFAVALAGIVASPLLPAALPSDCRLGSDGAARRGVLGWARRSWRDVRRIERVPVGVLLSPYARRHWLDGARALTLPMPAARRGEFAERAETLWRSHGG